MYLFIFWVKTGKIIIMTKIRQFQQRDLALLLGSELPDIEAHWKLRSKILDSLRKLLCNLHKTSQFTFDDHSVPDVIRHWIYLFCIRRYWPVQRKTSSDGFEVGVAACCPCHPALRTWSERRQRQCRRSTVRPSSLLLHTLPLKHNRASTCKL